MLYLASGGEICSPEIMLLHLMTGMTTNNNKINFSINMTELIVLIWLIQPKFHYLNSRIFIVKSINYYSMHVFLRERSKYNSMISRRRRRCLWIKKIKIKRMLTEQPAVPTWNIGKGIHLLAKINVNKDSRAPSTLYSCIKRLREFHLWNNNERHSTRLSKKKEWKKRRSPTGLMYH